ncbi:hypothetical protein T4B_9763 [Trichinella pseudospiralis]|uniref:Uncharacterized protein n=2 Tax=Trichinella pseudospiralis TaxID=6337 RepID=A0A0V1J0F4_TRIPS|nr:hypothetical protein T4B_9763 [Trichinella pseudospiralis]
MSTDRMQRNCRSSSRLLNREKIRRQSVFPDEFNFKHFSNNKLLAAIVIHVECSSLFIFLYQIFIKNYEMQDSMSKNMYNCYIFKRCLLSGELLFVAKYALPQTKCKNYKIMQRRFISMSSLATHSDIVLPAMRLSKFKAIERKVQDLTLNKFMPVENTTLKINYHIKL